MQILQLISQKTLFFHYTKKLSFPLRISAENADLVTFTEEILNEKLHILWSKRRRGSFPLSNNYLVDVLTLKDFLVLEKT